MCAASPYCALEDVPVLRARIQQLEACVAELQDLNAELLSGLVPAPLDDVEDSAEKWVAGLQEAVRGISALPMVVIEGLVAALEGTRPTKQQYTEACLAARLDDVPRLLRILKSVIDA
jgi:hypothetical protein